MVAATANAAPVTFNQIMQIINAKPGNANSGGFAQLRLAGGELIFTDEDGNDDEKGADDGKQKPPQDDRIITETRSEIVEDEVCDCAPIDIPKGGFPKYALFGLAAIPLLFLIPRDRDKPPPPPSPRKFDEFESLAFDDDKARLDAYAIELQNNPDSQGYIIMYQGTDKVSMRVRKVDVLSKRTLDYLVNARGIDPRRIVITNWGTRPKTTYELWVIPPGAQPPVPQ
ncbi:MAG: hypothetical protein M3Q33_04565 [Acidobacteriota bacterium]|nr:hypothetical protein [Acidobacteriota bacterium]